MKAAYIMLYHIFTYLKEMKGHKGPMACEGLSAANQPSEEDADEVEKVPPAVPPEVRPEVPPEVPPLPENVPMEGAARKEMPVEPADAVPAPPEAQGEKVAEAEAAAEVKEVETLPGASGGADVAKQAEKFDETGLNLLNPWWKQESLVSHGGRQSTLRT